MTRLVQLNLVQNVGPNQKASIRLPLGVTYNRIFLRTEGNLNVALLSNFVLKVNGNERQRWDSSAQLQARNSYNLGASDPNMIEFDFTERNAKDEAAMTLGAYAATAEAGVQDFNMEVNLGNYTNSAASKLIAFAEIDVPSANRMIVRSRVIQKVLAGATEESIIIPSGLNGELLKRMYVFGTLASINSIRIRREGSDEYEALSQGQNEFYQKTYGKVPQAGLWVVDFTGHNLQGHMLNTSSIMGPDGKPKPIQNLDIRLNTNAAGTFNIYTETLTTNDRP